jgi:hypothetical protein
MGTFRQLVPVGVTDKFHVKIRLTLNDALPRYRFLQIRFIMIACQVNGIAFIALEEGPLRIALADDVWKLMRLLFPRRHRLGLRFLALGFFPLVFTSHGDLSF